MRDIPLRLDSATDFDRARSLLHSARFDDEMIRRLLEITRFVFPAIFGGTLRFLELLPQRHSEAAVDLCSGSGIGAFGLTSP